MSARAERPDPLDGGEAGTTLVELLVAMALLSLVAMFIGEGVFALKRMAPVAARIAGADEVSAVREHLAATLGEAMTALPLGAMTRLEGTAATLRLTVPADPFLEAGGLAEVTLAAEPGGRGGLALVERRAVSRVGGGGQGAPVVLLDGIAGLRLAYGETPGADFADSWSGADGRLPALLRLEVDLPAGDPRRFAPLLVHPLVSPAPPPA